jgi:hypothetical protein
MMRAPSGDMMKTRETDSFTFFLSALNPVHNNGRVSRLLVLVPRKSDLIQMRDGAASPADTSCFPQPRLRPGGVLRRDVTSTTNRPPQALSSYGPTNQTCKQKALGGRQCRFCRPSKCSNFSTRWILTLLASGPRTPWLWPSRRPTSSTARD